MSDEGTAADAAPAEAPAAVPAEGAAAEALSQAAAAAPEAPAAAATEADEAPDLDDEGSEDLYADPAKAKAYAEKLRKEAAKYRTKAKEAEAWRDGWTDEDAKVLSDVIQIAAKDPKVGAAKMREIAALLDKGDVEGAAEVAAEASTKAGEAAKALTPEDVESKVKEALDADRRTREIESKRDEILAKTKELGYEPGSADYFTVLHMAQFETGGDLDAAHAKIEERNQAIVDKYVEGVRERAAGMPLHARRGDDSPIEIKGENKTFQSARERTEARILALSNGPQK